MSYFDDPIGDATPDLSALFAADDSPTASKREGSVMNARNMTLKEQEKKLDELQKENFNLKLRISYLEDGINRMTPESMRQAVHENVELKIRIEHLTNELEEALSKVSRYEQHNCRATEEDVERLRNEYARKFDDQQAHIDKLSVQLTEERRTANELRDKAMTFTEQKGSLAAANELFKIEMEANKTELQFARADAQSYKKELLDAQTILARVSPTKSPTGKMRNSSPRKQSAHGGNGSDSGDDSDSRSRRKYKRTIETDTEMRYADKLRKLHAQITAQNLIIGSRDEEIKRLNNNIAILSKELSDQGREIDMYRNTGGLPDDVLLGLHKDNQHFDALRIQAADLNRRMTDKTTEADLLKKELGTKMQGHDNTVLRLMQQWSGETDELKAKLRAAETEIKRSARNLVIAQQQLEKQQKVVQEKMEELEADANSKIKSAEQQAVSSERKASDLQKQVARLEAIVAQNDKSVEEYRREIFERVYQEEDMKREHKNLRSQLNTVSKTATNTVTDMDVLQKQLDEQSRKVEEVQEQFRHEVHRRCEIEEREMQRVKELDEMWRSEVQLRSVVEQQLQDRDKEIERLINANERGLKEVEEMQQVGHEIEREKERDNSRQEILSLQKKYIEAKEQSHKLKKILDIRSADLDKVRTQLLRWQSDASNHHDKLKDIVEQRHGDANKMRLQIDSLQRETTTKELLLKERDGRIEQLEQQNRTLNQQLGCSSPPTLLNEKKASHFFKSEGRPLADHNIASEKNSVPSVSTVRSENDTAPSLTKVYQLEKELANKSTRLNILIEENDRLRSMTTGKYSPVKASAILQLEERDNLLTKTVEVLMGVLSDRNRYSLSTIPRVQDGFARFAAFMDSRLQTLIMLHQKFDDRVKTVEEQWTRNFQLLIGRVDKRISKLDKFESVVQSAASSVKTWKDKLQDKQVELSLMKETSTRLLRQIEMLRSQTTTHGNSNDIISHSDGDVFARMRDAETRAFEAEQRLRENEELLARRFNDSTEDSEEVWCIRLRDREREVERTREQARRERINARDKVNELVDAARSLEKKLAIAEGKVQELQEVVAIQKATIESKVLAADMKRESFSGSLSEAKTNAIGGNRYERERTHREELERELLRLRRDLGLLNDLQRNNSRKIMRAVSRLETHQAKDAIILEVVEALREREPLPSASSPLSKLYRRSHDFSPNSIVGSGSNGRASSHRQRSQSPTPRKLYVIGTNDSHNFN